MITTPRGDKGLDLARDFLPKLILMDMNLPGMSGLEVFHHLQHSQETRDIPVIAISANALDLDIEKTLNSGFKAYLTKPLDVPRFLNTLKHFVGSDIRREEEPNRSKESNPTESNQNT